MWSKVAGYSMMIGGVVAAPYTGGASLALTAAGGKVLSADEQKEAAKKAEAQLTTASNKAIGTLTQAQRASEAAYAPYTQMGAGAVNALNSYMGLPPLASAAGPPGKAGPQPRDGVPFAPVPAGMDITRRQATPETATGSLGVPRDEALMPTPNTPELRAAQQTASSYVPLGGLNAGLVQMRAPDGTMQYVPRQQAPFYASRGAVEVG